MNKNDKLVLSFATVTFALGLVAGVQNARIHELKKDLSIKKIHIDLLKRCFKTAVAELTPEQRATVTENLEFDIEFTKIAQTF